MADQRADLGGAACAGVAVPKGTEQSARRRLRVQAPLGELGVEAVALQEAGESECRLDVADLVAIAYAIFQPLVDGPLEVGLIDYPEQEVDGRARTLRDRLRRFRFRHGRSAWKPSVRWSARHARHSLAAMGP